MSRILLAAIAVLIAVPAAAQEPATIRPGMSAREVVAVFGTPAVSRHAGDWLYLFYPNRCPIRCGSDDVIFLRDGEVVAAVLRSPRRRFAGAPASAILEDQPPSRGLELTADPARSSGGASPMAPAGGTGAVSGIRIRAGADAEPVGRRRSTNLGVIRGRPVYGAVAGAVVDTVDNAITATPESTLSPSAAGPPDPSRNVVPVRPLVPVVPVAPRDTVDNAITATPASTLSPSAAGAMDTLRRRAPPRRP